MHDSVAVPCATQATHGALQPLNPLMLHPSDPHPHYPVCRYYSQSHAHYPVCLHRPHPPQPLCSPHPTPSLTATCCV